MTQTQGDLVLISDPDPGRTGLISLSSSSSDYAKGFGGRFGVETDKVDQSAVGFEYQGKTEKHESQKGWCRWFT